MRSDESWRRRIAGAGIDLLDIHRVFSTATSRPSRSFPSVMSASVDRPAVNKSNTSIPAPLSSDFSRSTGARLNGASGKKWPKSYRLEIGDQGGYYTPDGKILTYWD
jgi:hypothetical protein